MTPRSPGCGVTSDAGRLPPWLSGIALFRVGRWTHWQYVVVRG